VKSSDAKCGMKIRMRDGTPGKLLDNSRSIIRRVEVEFYGRKDVGTCYIWEIEGVEADGKWERIELSKAQKKRMVEVRRSGF